MPTVQPPASTSQSKTKSSLQGRKVYKSQHKEGSRTRLWCPEGYKGYRAWTDEKFFLRNTPQIIHAITPVELQCKYDPFATKPRPRPRPATIEAIMGGVEKPTLKVVTRDQFPFAVPCTISSPDAPKNWVMGFDIVGPVQMAKILDQFKKIELANIKPGQTCANINRNKLNRIFYHGGVWFKVGRYRRPYLTKDGRNEAIQDFMKLLDRVNDKPNKLLYRHDRQSALHVGQAHVNNIKGALLHGEHKKGAVDSVAPPEVQKRLMKVIRLGKLGSAVGFGRGQAKGLHFDVGDDPRAYSVLIVAGTEWKTDKGQGNLVIPQLGLEIELRPGHVLFFQSSILAHYVRQLDDVDEDNRLGITVFTCNRLTRYFERLGNYSHDSGIAGDSGVEDSDPGDLDGEDNDLKDLDDLQLLCHFRHLSLDGAEVDDSVVNSPMS